MRAGAGDEVAQDAVRVSAELLSWAPTLSRSPLQVLARLHTVAAARSLPDDQLGRPRDPDSAAQAARRGRGARGGRRPAGHAVAAVAHAELADAAPFASHNGVVARAVERLVLVSRGVDEKSLVVPEAGPPGQPRGVRVEPRGVPHGRPAGVHAWLLYTAEAYAAGAEASPLKDA